MASIEYSNSPNVETAFVLRDDGKKNRAVLMAPQDTSTLEYPVNPNSTKGYVTVDGKKHRVVLTADISGSGGGAVVSVNGKTGTVVLDASDVGATSLSQPSVMPTLAVADWVLDSQDNKYKQTKNVSDVTANNVVYVSPFPANADEYGQCNVLCITQGAGTLTFQADVVPSNDLGVNVVILS